MNAKTQQPAYRSGQYPWDHWERAALECGMERTLAQLGRDVIRDASQHNWAKPLRQLCEGCAFEELLLRAPYLGRRLCEILLETDGLKIAYTEEEGPHCELIELPGFGGES